MACYCHVLLLYCQIEKVLSRKDTVADIVLINPRFDISFWGLEHCMPLFGKRANLPVACLGLLAALVPDHHEVTLVDENVEDIDFDRLARADLVCLTGMSIQGRRIIEILEAVRARGVMTAIGGPMATVEPEVLEGLADVIFLGEADETWPEFLAAWEAGTHKTRYEQSEKTDVTKLPLPRTDLLKVERYMFGSMQISRGCPFTCEFCDIIVTFGRRPRLKTSEQVLSELERFRDAGFKIVFVVDDNLIGNKKAIKPILRDIIRWQQERAYPLTLFTEASLDLAEDDELMDLMGLANFQNVFIGIETPNERSLRETKKLQNVRPNAGSLIERVHRIQDRGLDVWCGMIVGFDNDDRSIFNAVPEFLSRARISTALIGMLHAIPTTPLFERLKNEGRLHSDEDADRYGTNVAPLGMSPEELRDGFIQVMQDSYGAESYFERLDSQFFGQNFKFRLHELPYWKDRRWAWAKRVFFNYVRFGFVASRLLILVKDKALRSRYRKQLSQVIKERWREPHIMFIYALKTATHYHYAEVVRSVAAVDPKTGAMSDAGRSFSRTRKTAAERIAA
jgi:radical SAM superfamily enzyme YgiQ (UPF0313 family)